MYLAERQIETVRELQEILRVVLVDELGTFKNGRPSIWVEPPFAPSRGTGLHCAIRRQPIMLDHKPVRTTQANQTYQFVVTLTAELNDTDLAAFDRAADLVRSTFPRHTEMIAPVMDGRLAQADFFLEFSRTLNTTPILGA